MFTPRAVNLRIGCYIALATLYWLFSYVNAFAQQQAVAITSVAADQDSVKVVYKPVAGAKDYRIYDTSNPMAVKYAGLWHLDADQLGVYSKLAFATDNSGNILYPLRTVAVPAYSTEHHIDIPALEIELNGLAPGPHTLVVQAVDSLGPCPPANLYDANNLPTLNAAAMAAMGGEGMDTMLGANAGTTPDGMVSTNGQGPSTNKPNIIAQSQPFTVTTPGGLPELPTANATASFFDTFSSGTFAAVGEPDIIKGNQQFTLTTPVGAWDVIENHCDLRDTRPFVMNRHYMAVDFDGGSPGSNEPLHVAYSAVAISPQKAASIAGGQIVHCIMQVDAHTDTRRWVGFAVGDSNDPFTAFDWEEGEPVNKSNTGLWVQFEANNLLVDEIVAGKLHAITGAAGQATNAVYRQPFMGWQFGHGLDDRTRFDLFLSQTHFSIYEDGVKEAEFDLPEPLPFATAKIYDVQYLYHSDLEKTTLEQQYPYEQYWIQSFPYSDERHWSACGWETLPSTTWSSLSSLINLPKPMPPIYSSPTPPTPPDPLQAQVNMLTQQVTADKTQINTLTGQVNTLQSTIAAVKAALGQ